MTTLTITKTNNGYISVGPIGSKWSVVEWNYKLFWCLENLEQGDWIPLPQKGIIMMTPEAYFMYKLEHGHETET